MVSENNATRRNRSTQVKLNVLKPPEDVLPQELFHYLLSTFDPTSKSPLHQDDVLHISVDGDQHIAIITLVDSSKADLILRIFNGKPIRAAERESWPLLFDMPKEPTILERLTAWFR